MTTDIMGTAPTEQTNIAPSNLAKVAQLQALLDAYNAQQIESLWPFVIEEPIMVHKTEAETMLESDEYIYWPN